MTRTYGILSIRGIISGLPTLDQYTVLQRADVMFRSKCGRYYGGSITPSNWALLVDRIPYFENTHARASAK
mgnify:CR=1 FL=1